MFGHGRRFARRFGGGWEGWQGGGPPWMQQGPGPGGFRGPFGPGAGPQGFRGPFGGPGGPGPGARWGAPPEMQALWSEAAEVGRLFAIASRSAFENKESIGKLRSILDTARKGLTEIIYKEGQTGQTGSTSDGPGVEQA